MLRSGVCANSGRWARRRTRSRRRAGVTWGVIQYHFGSREGILLAMIEDGFAGLLDALDAFSELEPDSPEHALALLVDAVWKYCAQPDYLLYWDILRLLSHDPTSAQLVVSMLRQSQNQLNRRIAHLLRGTTTSDTTLRTVRSLVFATMPRAGVHEIAAGKRREFGGRTQAADPLPTPGGHLRIASTGGAVPLRCYVSGHAEVRA